MSANKRRGLGQGLDVLLGSNSVEQLIQDDKNRIKNVFINDIYPNEDQPRRAFDEQALEELASSIKRHGVLQPLIVTKDSKGRYRIVAGERRYRGAKRAGLKELPVIVRSFKELEELEVALIENVQRVDLSPFEQALSIYKLHEQFNIEYADIAKRLGKATTTISNIVRLLQLPPKAIQALQSGKISEGHARAILSIKNSSEQQKLLNLIIEKNFTVRQAEAYSTSLRTTQKPNKPESFQTTLKLPAVIRAKKRGGGEVVINYKSDEDLAKIKKLLS